MQSIEQPCLYPQIFTHNRASSGETRTLIVVIMTAVMMAAEITAGIVFGSIALLADGLHMASHAIALAINVYAYVYARRHANDRGFSFGTGKVNALGGFSGAVLLAVFVLIMAWESVDRLLDPVEIAFNQAILVAILGLLVNGVSVLILGEQHDHDHDHDHAHQHYDHNRRAAYLHVLADALTSLLAIFALLGGKYLGFTWMDPLVGIVGAILVSRWALGLIRVTTHVLLDKQEPELLQKVKSLLEKEPHTTVTDLHIWEIGPEQHSVVVAVQTSTTKTPADYKKLLAAENDIVHTIVEVNPQQ
ncbi:MAG: CDF family Co(II)/Ni(II) efflux transporter DmeF [Chloroflexota bacterium]